MAFFSYIVVYILSYYSSRVVISPAQSPLPYKTQFLSGEVVGKWKRFRGKQNTETLSMIS